MPKPATTKLEREVAQRLQKALADQRAKNEETNSYEFPWSTSLYVEGAAGRVALNIYERTDRPGEVQVSWREYDEAGKEKARPKPRVPDVFIRDARGRLLKRETAAAIDAAKAVYAERTAPAAGAQTDAAPATIREGLLEYAHPVSGQAMARNVRLYSTGILPDGSKSKKTTHALGTLESVKVRGTAVADMSYADFAALGIAGPEAVWRWVADKFTSQADELESAAGKMKGAAAAELLREAEHLRGRGHNVAVKAIDRIYSSASWLRQRGRLADGVCVPATKWRQALRSDWQKRTGRKLKPRRPGYAEHEMRAIVTTMRTWPDPRLVTALLLGMGLRKGQVIEDARRRALDLTPGTGAFGLGRLVIEGSETKPGAVLDLTPEQRRHLDRIMAPAARDESGRVTTRAGYLSVLEAAYQAGELHDYCLVTGGKLNQGVARIENAARHLNSTNLSKAFHKLEAAAGVERKPGRGWHGLRRGMKEMVEGFTSDEGVRDVIQGWTPGGGTRHIYADEAHARRVADAARVRAELWANLMGAEGAASVLDASASAVAEMTRRIQQHAGTPAVDRALALAAELQTALTAAAAAAQQAKSEESDEYGALSNADQEHERLAAELWAEVERLGLTGKAAAKVMEVSESYTSLIRQGRSLRVISTDRLRIMAGKLAEYAAQAPAGSAKE